MKWIWPTANMDHKKKNNDDHILISVYGMVSCNVAKLQRHALLAVKSANGCCVAANRVVQCLKYMAQGTQLFSTPMFECWNFELGKAVE